MLRASGASTPARALQACAHIPSSATTIPPTPHVLGYALSSAVLLCYAPSRSPFEAEDHMATYKKILTGKVVYPKRMDAHGMALVGCLLQRDISRRFGNLKDGAADIKRHAFFKGFNWDKAINIRGSFTVEPESASSFTDWIRAEEICVLGAKLSTEDDSAFATFGR